MSLTRRNLASKLGTQVLESSNEEGECRALLLLEMRKRITLTNIKYCTLQREFMLHPGVFNPEVSADLSQFIIQSFFKLAREEASKKSQRESVDFLEVGCGVGHTAISIALLSDKYHIWATGINEAAVKNTRANAKLHGVENRVYVVLANVFDHEEITGRKFDMIYWYHPWGGQGTKAGTEIEPIMRSFVDPGYQGLRNYLTRGAEHLKESGRLILAFSFSVGSEEKFTEIAKETGWSFKVIEETKFCQEIDGKSMELFVQIIELIKEVK